MSNFDLRGCPMGYLTGFEGNYETFADINWKCVGYDKR